MKSVKIHPRINRIEGQRGVRRLGEFAKKFKFPERSITPDISRFADGSALAYVSVCTDENHELPDAPNDSDRGIVL
jgi:hypothetical protein